MTQMVVPSDITHRIMTNRKYITEIQTQLCDKTSTCTCIRWELGSPHANRQFWGYTQACLHVLAVDIPELSMGSVNPLVGLGWVEIFQFLMGWVGSTITKLFKI